MTTDNKPQDGLQLLASDHRKVEDLFARFEKASGAAKEKIVKEICTELKIHSQIEEEIYYPEIAARWRRTRSTRPMSSMTAPSC